MVGLLTGDGAGAAVTEEEEASRCCSMSKGKPWRHELLRLTEAFFWDAL